MSYIYFNGRIIDAGTPVATAGSRGLRYGDGLFETMMVRQGQIVLGHLHFERLFNGLEQLQFTIPHSLNAVELTNAVTDLCGRNGLKEAARVRLNVFRGNGALSAIGDEEPHIVIESEPLPPHYLHYYADGLQLGICNEVRKSCDSLSNLKHNNYLPYAVAARYAKKQGWHDCLVLNSHQRVCDSTIANVFWIDDAHIFTPPLSEGCVAGVMRRHLLNQMRASGYPVQEKELTPETLRGAAEIFLTNSLFGIRGVRALGGKSYSGALSAKLYQHFIHPLIEG